ncbi:restriction endonuclease subunit S [Clostridium formicaceticum]|uniref:EcoKI restriction-modification system protein HsdS n=1 Tax=Clostridium formicaceticum TaxID=1497 RepID=A0AAC9RIY9_9CLOT|nr:restriction endonuclease subunit S [Clostridium formicaceticum]AOY77400.1 hypothetical protein BJL90_17000 [Clostridium formicaceticum]ARE87951.1 EcoKI restriction-modification system protein HsdS [Clostridium formicaceticum]
MSKWKMVKLGDIASLITKGTTPTTIGFQFEDIGVNFVKIESITETGMFIKDKFQYISTECNDKMKRSILCENDILFSIAGALGRTAIVDASILPANTNQALAIIRISKGNIDYKYIQLTLKSSFVYRQFQKQKQGVAQLNLSLKNISDLEIPLPPLDIQKHIADTLDKAQEIINGHKKQLEELDNLIKATFYDMFGDPIVNKKEWKEHKLGDMCTIVRGGSPRPIEKYLGGTIPWIKIGDATKGDDLYLTSTKEHIIEDGIKKSRYIKSGSMIFANCGVSLGFARIITFDGCIHDGWLAFDIKSDKLNNIFLLKQLNEMTEHFRRTAPSGTQPNLNTSIMKNIKIIVPPLYLQEKFTSIVLNIEEQKSIVKQSITESETLFNSLMSKYFD